MDILAIIAERKIREAMARGELDDLPGKGKPLAMDEFPAYRDRNIDRLGG
ncbi:MAG TPA: DnaJ family domain-containing protein [Nitrospirota bacterium]|nr:DnaJ family domain-containing protein [Nitrospirota bacterium]